MVAGPIDAAIAAGTTIANGLMQQRAAAYNQNVYRENMHANFLLSQQAQRNAARNEVEGLRQAGLSTALADGAAGAPQVTAASGTAQAPQFDPANLLLRSQIKLAESQAEKNEAEADSQKIKNKREKSYDLALSQNLASYYESLVDSTYDDDLKDFFADQASFARKGKANEGNKRALLDYFDLQGKNEEAIARKMDKKLTAWLSELRWNKAKGHTDETNPFVKSLVTLDARQSDLLAAEAANIIASGKNMEQQIELTKQRIELTKEQREQVKAAAEAMNDQNMMHWIDKGEYGKALMVGFIQIFSGLAQKGRSYATND